MEKTDRGKAVFYLLSLAGIVVCALTELEKISPAVRALCGGDTGACAQVGESEYSRLFGIPLGILGLVSYITLAALYRFKKVLALFFGGFLMGAEIYFVFLQSSIIQVFCPLCMAQFSIVLVLFILLLATAAPEEGKDKVRAGAIILVGVSFLAFFVPFKMSYTGVPARMESLTSWGDPDSRFRMEVFSDYECGHCQKYDDTVKEVINGYPQIYIVFHDFIIGRHKLSPLAVAYAGSVAYFEGKERYLNERFTIFDNQKDLFNYITPRFEAIPEDPAMKQAVKEKLKMDFDLAKKLDIRGTPTTLLVADGKLVKKFSGSKSFDELKPELDALLKR